MVSTTRHDAIKGEASETSALTALGAKHVHQPLALCLCPCYLSNRHMSRVKQTTKVVYAYYRTAVRHRGYNQRKPYNRVHRPTGNFVQAYWYPSAPITAQIAFVVDVGGGHKFYKYVLPSSIGVWNGWRASPTPMLFLSTELKQLREEINVFATWAAAMASATYSTGMMDSIPPGYADFFTFSG
jgi:hypothetical protein